MGVAGDARSDAEEERLRRPGRCPGNLQDQLPSRNVQTAKVVNSYGLNIYDLVNHQKVVLTPKTVEELTGILQPRARDDEEERFRSHSSEGEAAEQPRRAPRDRGVQA